MRLTYVPTGTPPKRPVSSSQLPPSFRVSQTLPSSVPAYNRPGRSGDSASDTIVQYVSAPVTSGVMPPVARAPVRLLQHDAIAGREVQTRHVAALRFDVDRVRVGRILGRVEAVAAANGRPIGVREVALAPPRGAAPGAVVLESRADAVGEIQVVADDVRLPDRERI